MSGRMDVWKMDEWKDKLVGRNEWKMDEWKDK